MTSNDYLHINEAVKKHGKTRQTFYNYIHKGLVRTKKVNNKVYLHAQDVEQLMNGYIPPAIKPAQVKTTSEAQEAFHEDDVIESDSITPPQTPKSNMSETDKNTILKDLARLHQQYYDLKDSILQQVHNSKQDLLFDSKVLSQNAEQRMLLHLGEKLDLIQQKNNNQQGGYGKLQLLQKKSIFRAAYACFLVINLLVINYVL